MFYATIISKSKGTSKKTGNPYYKAEFIAETITGGNKVVSTFCTEKAYLDLLAFNSMDRGLVSCGVNDNGYLVINGVKAVKATD